MGLRIMHDGVARSLLQAPLKVLNKSQWEDIGSPNGRLRYYDADAEQWFGMLNLRTPEQVTSLALTADDTEAAITVLWSTPISRVPDYYELQVGVHSTFVGAEILYVQGNLIVFEGAAATTYYMRIRAWTSLGPGLWSPTASATTPGAAYPNLVPTFSSITSSSFVATWQQQGLSTRYRVRLPSTGWTARTVTNHTFTGLRPGTAYVVYVSAFITGSGWTPPQTGRVLTLPAAPAVSITGLGGTSIIVSWTMVPSAGKYRIRHNSGAWEETKELESTRTGLASGLHTYDVQAHNDSGWSASGSASIQIGGAPAAPAPTVSAGDESITITWPPVAGATKFRARRGTLAWVETDKLSIQFVNLVNGTRYSFAVQAGNSFGWSASANIDGTPRAPTLAKLTTPNIPSASKTNCQWSLGFSRRRCDNHYSVSPVTHATSYEWQAQVRQQNIQSGVWGGWTTYTAALGSAQTGTASQLIDKEGQLYTYQYRFRVRAKALGYETSEWSAYSGTSGKVPIAPSPRAVTSDARVVLIWASIPGALKYRVRRGTNAWIETTSTSYQFSGLTNGTAYRFSVQAYNQYGWSTSGVVSATPRPDTNPTLNTPEKPSATKTRCQWRFGFTSQLCDYDCSVTAVEHATSYEWQAQRSDRRLAGTPAVSFGGWYYYNIFLPRTRAITARLLWTFASGVRESRYRFRVRAKAEGYRTSDWSAWSDSLLSLPGAPVPTATPAGSGFTLAWPAVQRADVYRWRIVGGGQSGAWSETTATSVSITGLELNVLYTMTVQAGNGAGWGPGGSVDATLEGAVPAAPVVSASPGQRSMVLNWPLVPNATKYRYRRGTGIWVESTVNVAVFLGLQPNTTYQFSVEAGNDVGWSPTTTISAKTLPASALLSSEPVQLPTPAAPVIESKEDCAFLPGGEPAMKACRLRYSVGAVPGADVYEIAFDAQSRDYADGAWGAWTARGTLATALGMSGRTARLRMIQPRTQQWRWRAQARVSGSSGEPSEWSAYSAWFEGA